MKIRLIAFLTILILTVAAAAQTTPAPLTANEYIRVDARPECGFTYPYYLYVPPELREAGARRNTQTLLVLSNNTLAGPHDDFGVHEADVIKRMSMGGGIASHLEVAIIMPVFPRPRADWRIYTLALDRDSMVTDKKEYRRLDLQMIAMIDDARDRLAKEKLKVDRRVLINGFSAQGMFANRFTFLHPDRVKAAVIGSPGGWPMAPTVKFNDKDLRYPIGIADLKAVAGRPLDLKRLKKVPLFFFLGDKDDNDSVPFDDSYDAVDRTLIFDTFGKTPVSRWATAESLYKQAGLNAVFRLYPGVAHTVTSEMRDDIRAFLLKHK